MTKSRKLPVAYAAGFKVRGYLLHIAAVQPAIQIL
jgi:hypothetical protein